MKYSKLANIILRTVVSCSLLALAACDTEYENAPYPYKELTSFVVNAGGSSITASIVKNEIILYWPYTINQPASVTPQITVSENAAINPASGTAIQLQNGVTYTVTAQDGTTSVYTVKLVVNQPELTVYEEQRTTVMFGNLLDIQGTGFILDSLSNQVFLVATSGAETQLPVFAVTDMFGTGFASNVQVTLPKESTAALDTGLYRVKIKSGTQTITSSQAYVYVRYPAPTFDPITIAFKAKTGETITLTGKNFRLFSNARLLAKAGTETFYDLELVSHTLTSATYRIPDTAPAGEYFTIMPGITDTVSKVFAYSYALYGFPHIHPMVIITD